MQSGDGAPDLNEIAERYSQMNDDALMDEARAYDSLIDEVKPLLRTEFARRGLEPPLVEDGPDVEMRHLVTVDRFLNLTEASLAQGLLESAGIESFLRDTNVVRNDWFYSNAIGGIRLDVDEKDLDAARALLAQPIPESIAAEDGTSYKQPFCPQCHSLDVSFKKTDDRIPLAALGFIGIPVPKPKVNRWECAACGARWQDDGETEAGLAPVG